MKALSGEDPRWIGDYRLLGRLGEGGMGRVYLARSGRGRTVAVKAVQDELARQPDFRRRFAQEITAARKVGGEWTAPVLDADTEAKTPWVATGYIAGPPLSEVVAEQFGPLPQESVTALASGLVRALQAIHGAGLVHRDLKPSNILLTIDGPRVIDFGIARALDSAVQSGGDLTRPGALVGSPGFMSPEQVRGRPVTPASDVFCLGAVLAYAVTGRMPFGTADSGVHALLYRIAMEEPELHGLQGELRELVVGCLSKDPAGRPTVETLLQRTAGWMQGRTWLPGEVLAELGRHAVQLLDSEDPASTGELRAVRESEQRKDAQAAGTVGTVGTPSTPGTPTSSRTTDVPGQADGPAAGGPPAGTSAAPGGPAAPSPPPAGSYGPPAPPAPAAYGAYSTPPHQQQPWAQQQFPAQAPVPAPAPAPSPAAAPPSAGTPPPPGSRRGPRPVRSLSRGLATMLAVLLLFLLVGAFVDMIVYGALSDTQERLTAPLLTRNIDGYAGLRGATLASEVILGLTNVVVVVLWLVWFRRIRVNAEHLSPGGVRYSVEMAVLVWFLPVCNVFMPKQIMNDVWTASASGDPQWYGGPRLKAPRGLVHFWWWLWLFDLCLSVLRYESWYDKPRVQGAADSAALAVFSDMISIPSAIVAMILVTRVGTLQDERLRNT
jgi:serine/threonine protein kinase